MNQKSPFISPVIMPSWPAKSHWNEVLSECFATPWWDKLAKFVAKQRVEHMVYPPACDVFQAYALTPIEKVRFVILGQDPYHGPQQANGLSFSVRGGIKIPPSLVNIFKELHSDIGCPIPGSGCLSNWARQGGLLLNTVLTVRAAEANSHRGMGWEEFTDATIRAINTHCERVVFVLWGRPAKKKRLLIDDSRHCVIESPHPSPLSAHRGFFGSKPFSQINNYLGSHGFQEIDWSLS